MNFDEYQKKAQETAVYKRITGFEYLYPALGLAGESGEVIEKLKKLFRKDEAPSAEALQEIKKEIGDVLWYVSQIATEMKLSLGEIAAGNIEKLKDRKERGVLHAAGGDNR